MLRTRKYIKRKKIMKNNISTIGVLTDGLVVRVISISASALRSKNRYVLK